MRRAVVLCCVLLLSGCEGPEGPTGATGPAGPAGPSGPAGPAGEDGTDGKSAPPVVYARSSACKHCHGAIHAAWSDSGHAHAMVKVEGQRPPDPPHSVYPTLPPTDDTGTSHSWSDVTYIVGGYGWQAVFADAKGYLITGSQSAWLTKTKQWQAFDAAVAPGTRSLTCPECHATGFIPADAHEVGGKQGSLEGAGGKWIEEGVSCERCHGPASQHVLAVGYGPIKVDRSSSFCGTCHGAPPLSSIAARDGLIAQGQQWNELGSTKMRVVDCVDCHDPHRSAHFDDATVNPDRGIITRCEACHYKKKDKHKVAKHPSVSGGPTCVDCHMPRAVKSALGGATQWSGDLRAHLFRINTDSTASQLSGDGKTVMPYLTLQLACRQCHPDTAAKPDSLLQSNATGYHD